MPAFNEWVELETPSASVPLTGAEVVPVVQNGQTRHVAVAALTQGSGSGAGTSSAIAFDADGVPYVSEGVDDPSIGFDVDGVPYITSQ